jgi:hypothetical protein
VCSEQSSLRMGDLAGSRCDLNFFHIILIFMIFKKNGFFQFLIFFEFFKFSNLSGAYFFVPSGTYSNMRHT